MSLKFNIILIFVIYSFVLQAQVDEAFIKVQDGLKQFDEGNYKEAIRSYNEALKVNKLYEMALYEKALALQNLNKEREALKIARSLKRLNGSYTIDGLILEADIYEKNEQKDKLIEVLKTAVKKYPESVNLHLRLGQVYYKYRKYSSAERVLKKTFELDNKNINTLSTLTYTMIARKKYVKSILCIYQYLLLDPIAKEANYFYSYLKGNINPILQKNRVENEVSLINKQMYQDSIQYKDEFEALSVSTKTFIESLQLTRGYNKEFWWYNFIDFYKGIIRSDNSDLLVYYIAKYQGVRENENWKNFGVNNRQLLSYKSKIEINTLNLAGKE